MTNRLPWGDHILLHWSSENLLKGRGWPVGWGEWYWDLASLQSLKYPVPLKMSTQKSAPQCLVPLSSGLGSVHLRFGGMERGTASAYCSSRAMGTSTLSRLCGLWKLQWSLYQLSVMVQSVANANITTAVKKLNLHFGSLLVLPLLVEVCMLKGSCLGS